MNTPSGQTSGVRITTACPSEADIGRLQTCGTHLLGYRMLTLTLTILILATSLVSVPATKQLKHTPNSNSISISRLELPSGIRDQIKVRVLFSMYSSPEISCEGTGTGPGGGAEIDVGKSELLTARENLHAGGSHPIRIKL